MKEEIKTVKVVEICDFEGCEQDLSTYKDKDQNMGTGRECCICKKVFCDKHLIVIGWLTPLHGYELMCDQCNNKYDKKISPLLTKMYKSHEESLEMQMQLAKMSEERDRMWQKVLEICGIERGDDV